MTARDADALSLKPAGLGRYTVRVLLAVALLATALLAAATPAAAGIGDDLDTILRRQGFDPVRVGVHIWDVDAARKVHARNADVPYMPGSNLKLVTAAAALLNWGPEHRFVTELYGPDAPVVDGVLHGDLHLRGLGDPSLSTLTYQRRELHFDTAALDAFAWGLTARGVHKVKGRVLGDETWFDTQRTVATWRPTLVDSCAPLSALTGNGSLRDGKRVPSPAAHAAGLLKGRLKAAGIEVSGAPGTAPVPPQAKLFQVQTSAPLRILLKHMNRESDNHFAEVLLKGLGREFYAEGSTETGMLLSEEALAAMDVPRHAYVIQDGSGLSYGNRLTPAAITRLLVAMWQRPDSRVFQDSLAVAGENGTLRDRMRNSPAAGNARAKTGTLNAMSGLSGYVRSANGHLVAFAILMTGDPIDWQKAHRAQDDMVAALADARLPGRRTIRVTPTWRQHVVSADRCVHSVGGVLQPSLQP